MKQKGAKGNTNLNLSDTVRLRELKNELASVSNKAEANPTKRKLEENLKHGMTL
ncbi:hypothetical protein OV760_27360 [Salmonella enterica subsp. enterica serovar 1,4,[5],12:i:-]|nr:hypothetical protein [Salmonella enterica subsp. enterica serovar 1,4,[5],12:i:-]